MNALAQDPTRSASSPQLQDGPDVQLSLSEIRSLCTRAARGAGFDWGHADEAGWAAAWLVAAGLPGPSILLGVLQEQRCHGPVPQPGRWVASGGPVCPLRAGVALADHCKLPEGPGPAPLVLEQVRFPAFVLPFVARAAGQLAQGLRIRTGFLMSTVVKEGLIFEQTDDLGHLPSLADITITRAMAMHGSPNSHPQSGADVRLQDWRALDALALRMTVPPSDLSRNRAGSGGDDND